MNYTEKMDLYTRRLGDILSHAGGKPVTAGVGVYKHDDPTRTLQQIQAATAKGAKGICLFSYESLYDSVNPEQDRSEKGRVLQQEVLLPDRRPDLRRLPDVPERAAGL